MIASQESIYPAVLVDSSFAYYGVLLQPLGDDGDIVLILGHHDMKRAVAALNRYCREDLGLLNMFDDLSTAYADAVADLDNRWAKLITQCSAANEPWHSDECGLCAVIHSAIKEGGWWVQYNYTEDEPGVFPVMVWQE